MGTLAVSVPDRHCLWDAVWVADASRAGIQLKTPARLGQKRPWFDRLKSWAIDHAGVSRVVALVLSLGVIAISLWVCSLLPHDAKQLMPLPAAVALTIPWVLILFDWSGYRRLLARCAMHERVRIMRSKLTSITAEEVRDRREYWRERLQASQSLAAGVVMGRHSLVWRLMWCGWISITAYMCADYKFATPPKASVIPLWGFAVVVAVCAGFLAIHELRGRQVRKRLMRSLSGTECPDCGYEIDPGPPIQLGSGANIYAGQPRCSECGCRWPLVPPPVWIVQTEQGESRWNGVGNLRPISKSDR